MSAAQNDDYDYIVVGSVAGGGTVAARLAEAGMKVLLLEAGSDPRVEQDSGLAHQYQVPDAILEAAKTTPRHSTTHPPSQRDVHV
jgi:choline dehydrogenase-like flavoprotein